MCFIDTRPALIAEADAAFKAPKGANGNLSDEQIARDNDIEAELAEVNGLIATAERHAERMRTAPASARAPRAPSPTWASR
jgi:hypothetical protein